jgi:hypothetical protein
MFKWFKRKSVDVNESAPSDPAVSEGEDSELRGRLDALESRVDLMEKRVDEAEYE